MAYFNGPTSVVSSPNHLWDNVNNILTVSSGAAGGSAIIGTNSAATNASVGVLGLASGNANVSGVQGQTSSTTAGASGVSGFATAATGNTFGVYGQSNSPTGSGVVGFANAAQATGVFGSSQVAGTTGGNFGIVGIANNNTNFSNGVDGETSTAGMDGVRGLALGTTGSMAGVVGVNTSTVGGNANAFGVIGQASGVAASAGTQHIGVLGSASGAQFNAALFANGGETVITNSNTISTTPQLPRSWNGSMFLQAASATTTGGRIWWQSNGFIFFVNSTGSADYSEFFATADRSLAVGEIVALDPERANSVRRARPSDRGTTVGVVSLGGTRYNNSAKGDRDEDPDYINVGMSGQVPVLISLENGDIKPGDPLTLSTRVRGRAVKALGPARIVGYAMTHFPYVEGEKDYLEDIMGGSLQRLEAPHVMIYLNVGWNEPTAELGDGEEPEPLESEHEMRARLNLEIVPPGQEDMLRREALIKDAQKQKNTDPAPQHIFGETRPGQAIFAPQSSPDEPDLLFTPNTDNVSQ
ncbi:MAG TPA: hypothetical protein PK156_36750 [Polyangium sp.]|nr:hypothetical protein [Polyangium sp.]